MEEREGEREEMGEGGGERWGEITLGGIKQGFSASCLFYLHGFSHFLSFPLLPFSISLPIFS